VTGPIFRRNLYSYIDERFDFETIQQKGHIICARCGGRKACLRFKVGLLTLCFGRFLRIIAYRFLTEEDDVWSKNAWDHVPPPADQLEKITKSLSKQRLKPVPQDEKENYNSKPAKHWCVYFTIPSPLALKIHRPGTISTRCMQATFFETVNGTIGFQTEWCVSSQASRVIY
jgi:hypothetical protein